jgi:hypothetical protein
MIGWKGDFRRDDQVEVAFDLVSAAGARALGIGDYGTRSAARPISSLSPPAASPKQSPLIRCASSYYSTDRLSPTTALSWLHRHGSQAWDKPVLALAASLFE